MRQAVASFPTLKKIGPFGLNFQQVPEVGLEPTPLARHDFESCASTIPPLRQYSYTSIIYHTTYSIITLRTTVGHGLQSLLLQVFAKVQATSTPPRLSRQASTCLRSCDVMKAKQFAFIFHISCVYHFASTQELYTFWISPL